MLKGSPLFQRTFEPHPRSVCQHVFRKAEHAFNVNRLDSRVMECQFGERNFFANPIALAFIGGAQHIAVPFAPMQRQADLKRRKSSGSPPRTIFF